MTLYLHTRLTVSLPNDSAARKKNNRHLIAPSLLEIIYIMQFFRFTKLSSQGSVFGTESSKKGDQACPYWVKQVISHGYRLK